MKRNAIQYGLLIALAHGKELHKFTAPTFFAAAKLDNPQVLNREHTEVVVQPGESKDVFLPPARPAPMICVAATTIGTAWWAASPSADDRLYFPYLAAITNRRPTPRQHKVNRRAAGARSANPISMPPHPIKRMGIDF
jgi:hypothetical protein